MKAVCTGFTTPADAPASVILKESPGAPSTQPSPGEGGEERLPAQSIIIQQPARPTPWPRMSAGPIEIQHLRERPDPTQRPMTSRGWGVPQWSISTASTPLVCHCLPFQRPMRIQGSHLAWTTLNFLGFLSRPQPGFDCHPQQLSTALDLASPHLLFSNPTPNPSLDCLLGQWWQNYDTRVTSDTRRDFVWHTGKKLIKIFSIAHLIKGTKHSVQIFSFIISWCGEVKIKLYWKCMSVSYYVPFIIHNYDSLRSDTRREKKIQNNIFLTRQLKSLAITVLGA